MSDDIEPTQEGKKTHPLLKGAKFLLYMMLEQIVYAAALMYQAIIPSSLVWLFLSLVHPVDWFVIWLGISGLAITYRYAR